MTGKRYQRDRFSGWPAVMTVIAVLLLWALLLAFGTLTGSRFLPARPLIVMACMLFFSSLWMLAVLVRNRTSRP